MYIYYNRKKSRRSSVSRRVSFSHLVNVRTFERSDQWRSPEAGRVPSEKEDVYHYQIFIFLIK